jgi:hypothetical protein
MVVKLMMDEYILNLHFKYLSDFQIHTLGWIKITKLKFVIISVETCIVKPMKNLTVLYYKLTIGVKTKVLVSLFGKKKY